MKQYSLDGMITTFGSVTKLGDHGVICVKGNALFIRKVKAG